MNLAVKVDQPELSELLFYIAPERPVFIWGAPGIGKSSIVRRFAEDYGIDCVSLLGSQLAPEDIIGVPQIAGGTSVFCPPRQLVRSKPFVLFLDELNACTPEVQKAFYSLILDRRIGEYELPKGSIVIAAGNRAQDNAITRPLSSALINRMVQVELEPSSRAWLRWAAEAGIHRYIYDYISIRPDHLWSEPPKIEEPFSTPRSWEMLSDALKGFGAAAIDEKMLKCLAFGCLTPSHATQFCAYIKQVQNQYQLSKLLSGEARWPADPVDRDVLYFLAQSLRAQLIKELPANKADLGGTAHPLAQRGKELIAQLAEISLEVAQMVVVPDDKGRALPDWYMVELVRSLPRLSERRKQ